MTDWLNDLGESAGDLLEAIRNEATGIVEDSDAVAAVGEALADSFTTLMPDVDLGDWEEFAESLTPGQLDAFAELGVVVGVAVGLVADLTVVLEAIKSGTADAATVQASAELVASCWSFVDAASDVVSGLVAEFADPAVDHVVIDTCPLIARHIGLM